MEIIGTSHYARVLGIVPYRELIIIRTLAILKGRFPCEERFKKVNYLVVMTIAVINAIGQTTLTFYWSFY